MISFTVEIASEKRDKAEARIMIAEKTATDVAALFALPLSVMAQMAPIIAHPQILKSTVIVRIWFLSR
jgi:hypothetical protein